MPALDTPESAAETGSETRIVTFGCRLNAFESEVMREHARAGGLTDIVLFNTCAVTAEAERQARQAIRKARRENPAARIVVTGCAAQIRPEMFADMPEVDLVLGNREKLDAGTFRRLAEPAAPDGAGTPRIVVDDIMTIRETAGHLAPHLVAGFDGRARAFVQVQQGCDHRCTFCIIPYGRGPSRSVAPDQVIAQIRALVAAGTREVVLTGVDITSYGADLPERPALGTLVRRLLREVPELPRLRLTSLDPVEVDEELFRALAEEERLMPHLHLSLQAGDDLILKRMKRRHSRADAMGFVARVRDLRPDVVFGADLIAGFPTETEAMFANSLALVEDCDLTFLHVFPYSARSGTPAARMPQVPVAVRRERAARLRAAGEAAKRRFYDAQQGAAVAVLVETAEGPQSRGHSAQFAPVTLTRAAAPGEIVAARVTGADDGGLTAEPATARSAA
ncbi:MAG: tRNA (N(6)-L-threonylcarbamoyladenosine(37)-C(2))-methylthiotransferase MtaB [Alphaproteobacteria bacterium]|nr:MAG: tRNA (N(6)-L-threonylcarbamoyladenosine(37)-C(2))-methylthiotransferase MtaB [Alphaproteobacteria bacterium]